MGAKVSQLANLFQSRSKEDLYSPAATVNSTTSTTPPPPPLTHGSRSSSRNETDKEIHEVFLFFEFLFMLLLLLLLRACTSKQLGLIEF